MRAHTHYYRRVIGLDIPQRMPFTEYNFNEMGLRRTSHGMPHLEALELINNWNRVASDVTFHID